MQSTKKFYIFSSFFPKFQWKAFLKKLLWFFLWTCIYRKKLKCTYYSGHKKILNWVKRWILKTAMWIPLSTPSYIKYRIILSKFWTVFLPYGEKAELRFSVLTRKRYVHINSTQNFSCFSWILKPLEKARIGVHWLFCYYILKKHNF